VGRGTVVTRAKGYVFLSGQHGNGADVSGLRVIRPLCGAEQISASVERMSANDPKRNSSALHKDTYKYGSGYAVAGLYFVSRHRERGGDAAPAR
jgi:hypothetical protein